MKASDLLQANGIVWVEGISDVIYLRRWILLFCDLTGCAVPVEGSEYAFMEYGGRCLNHFDFSATRAEEMQEEDARWLLPAPSVSRNTYVVMDRDRPNASEEINATKLHAAETASGRWITEGREIENYLPPAVATLVFGGAVGSYESASEVFMLQKGKKLDKKNAAVQAASLLDVDNWRHLDLEAQIRLLVGAITSWNPVYTRSDVS